MFSTFSLSSWLKPLAPPPYIIDLAMPKGLSTQPAPTASPPRMFDPDTAIDESAFWCAAHDRADCYIMGLMASQAVCRSQLASALEIIHHCRETAYWDDRASAQMHNSLQYHIHNIRNHADSADAAIRQALQHLENIGRFDLHYKNSIFATMTEDRIHQYLPPREPQRTVADMHIAKGKHKFPKGKGRASPAATSAAPIGSTQTTPPPQPTTTTTPTNRIHLTHPANPWRPSQPTQTPWDIPESDTGSYGMARSDHIPP